MNIEEISTEYSEYWDSVVSSFHNYDVCYLCGYAKAFMESGEGTPYLIYINNESTRAINVVMKRDISGFQTFKEALEPNEWYDISSPYGYGGFLVEGCEYDAINSTYDKYCRDQGIISEFVRFNLFSDYHHFYNGTVEARTHNVIRSLDIPLENIKMDFEHKVRKNIKHAVSAGLEIKIDPQGEYLEDFIKIYQMTMDRNNASSKYYFSNSFFEKLLLMKNNAIFFHVEFEGSIISTELVLYAGDRCYSFLGGTDSNYYHLRPNDLLKFEVIKWGQNNGLKYYILGGGYGDDDGIFRYKKSFAPNGIYTFYIGKKICNFKKYEILCDLKSRKDKVLANEHFFPSYRAT